MNAPPTLATIIVASLFTGLLATAAGTGLGYSLARRDIAQAIAVRPPLAVVDYRPVTTALAQGAGPPDLEPAFREIKRRTAALADAGYIVLNLASIETAPDDTIVPSPPITIPQLDGVAAALAGVPLPAASPPSPAAPNTTTPAPDEAADILRSLLEGRP